MRTTFTVHGEPQGKARPRVVTNNGRTHAYTPKNTALYEEQVRLAYRQTKATCLDADVRMVVHAYFKMPNSASKRDRKLMANGTIRPVKKPDADNIGKAIADALNGIAYHDDSQIVDMIVGKWYGEQPRVEVTLMEVNCEG